VIDVQAYLGLRYLRGGRERPAVDCWGLARLIYRETFGVELDPHDTAPWGSAEVGREIVEERGAWLLVDRAAIRPGDIAFLRRIGRPFHVAVVLDRRCMIHADEGIDVCVEPIASQIGRVEFYRHPALRDHLHLSAAPL